MVLIHMHANSANELDDGDIGTDIFTYTVSDGSLTDTATLTITVEGINDSPFAQDDYGFINENSTLTVSNGDNATTDTTTTNLTSKTLIRWLYNRRSVWNKILDLIDDGS